MRKQHSTGKLAVHACAVTALAWLMCWLLIFGSKCDMGKNLDPIITNLMNTFEKHDISCYLDDGTLLGFYRDGRVTSFEFDADISIAFEDLSKVVALREYLKEHFDYTLYAEGDYIFQKGWTMLYQLKWDPYISGAPCARIYDPAKWYYADIYCDHRVDKEGMLNLTKLPPPGWNAPENEGKMFLCDLEPAPENCVFEDVIHPIKHIPGLGRMLPVPNDIPTLLSQIYGPQGWQKPQAKGIKVIMCNPVGWWAMLLVFLAIMAILALPLRDYIRERMRGPHVLPMARPR